MNILLIGKGKQLHLVARSFLAKGHRLTILCGDPEECGRLSRDLKVTVVCGDAGLPRVLEEAGILHADRVLVMTSRDEDNLIIAQLAMLKFAVPDVLVLVNDPENEAVFHSLGVTGTFAVVGILSNLIEQKARFSSTLQLFAAAGGKVHITEAVLQEDSPAAGRLVKDLGLPSSSLISVVVRDGEVIIPRGETLLKANDRLLLISESDSYGALHAAVVGREDA